jgi:HEAT repeat protein
MLKCPSLVTSVLAFVILPSALSQKAPEVGSVRLSRIGDLLRIQHIELTEPALLRALNNPNPDVRFLAAMKLEEDKAVDAIPAIKEALAIERVPRDRVNMAVALGLLGDPAGHAELKKVCADRNFIPEFRLYAVRYMFDLHFQDADCLRAAEEVAESKDLRPGDRVSALSLLPQFQNLTPEESQEVFELVLKCLEDPEPIVRMAASDALASLGNPSAIPYIEAAIAKEQEEGTRLVFQRDLKKLR